MPKSVRILAASMTAALVVFVLNSQPLQALGPTVMMFYGGTLKKPVFVTDADTAPFNDLLHPSSITVTDLGDRPYLNVALFWGSKADPANNGRRTLAELTPEMAWQHGRFYPAAAGRPPVLLVTGLTKGAQPIPIPSNGAAFVWGGPVPDSGIAVLQRLGIIAGPRR